MKITSTRLAEGLYTGYPLTIRANGVVLLARLYPKDHAQLDPGAVVEHKHLDGVFAWIDTQQQVRDAARLASPTLTARDKRHVRAGIPLRTSAAPAE